MGRPTEQTQRQPGDSQDNSIGGVLGDEECLELVGCEPTQAGQGDVLTHERAGPARGFLSVRVDQRDRLLRRPRRSFGGVPGSSSGVSTQAAYAFILTHPGIPTVFFLDWKERGSDLSGAIDNLIRIRKANRVFRNSRVFVDRAEHGLYAAYVGEENTEKLAVKIGKTGWNNYETWVPNPALGLSQAFTRFEASGHAYCVFYRNAVPLSN